MGRGAGALRHAFSRAVADACQSRVSRESTTYRDQIQGDVASDANGNFVVVWYGPDGGAYGIFGQRYDAAGAPQGAEIRVNAQTVGTHSYPSVASNPAGGFVVTWQSYVQDAYDVFGRLFDASGTPLASEFRVNSYTTDIQMRPAVGSDPDGNFVVVWMSYMQDGSEWGVFGQRYDAAGAPRGGEFRANVITTVGSQLYPRVAATTGGRFGVVWQAYDALESGVFAEFWDSSGLPSGDLQINSHITGSQSRPDVAADPAGNFVVVWQSYGQDGSGLGVFGRRFSPSGNDLGPEFAVNSYTTSDQASPAVSASADGFVVVWHGLAETDDGSGDTDVFGRRFDAAGGSPGAPLRINTYTTGQQRIPSIAADANGTFVVVWRSEDGGGHPMGVPGYGVFGQRLGPAPLDLVFKDGFDTIECPPPPQPCFPL